MTTIRTLCWKDLLRVPAFDLGVDGKVIMPSIETGLNACGPYNLVAEAPGKHIMGFICASLEKNENSMMGSIDKCRGNRLYEKMEPMADLISELEKILYLENAVGAITADVPDPCSTKIADMYSKLGYTEIVLPGRKIVRWFKTQEQEEAEAAGQEEAEAAGQEEAGAEIRGSTSKASTEASDTSLLENLTEAFVVALDTVQESAQRRRQRIREIAEEVASTFEPAIPSQHRRRRLSKEEAEEAELLRRHQLMYPLNHEIAEASTSAPAIPSQHRRRERGSTSKASTSAPAPP